jgi:hypothetical protein
MQNVFEAAKRALNQTDGSSHPPPNRHVADVESKLDSLRRLINEHDTAAVEVVDSLEDAFAESSQNYDSLKRLAQSVMAYDFEAAAEQLDTLTVRLKNLVS